MTYILHRMATHLKNYEYVKRWRDKNKAKYNPMNSKYATRCYHWKKISRESNFPFPVQSQKLVTPESKIGISAC